EPQLDGALGLERGPRLREVREGDARKSQRRATEIHLGAGGGGVARDERRLGLEEAHLPTARQTNGRGRGRVLRFGQNGTRPPNFATAASPCSPVVSHRTRGSRV